MLITAPSSHHPRVSRVGLGQNPEMDSALRVLRALQAALVVSVVLYLVLAMRLPAPPPASTAPAMLAALGFLSVMNVGIVFLLRRILVRRSEAILENNPEDPAALLRWRGGHIATYAVAESIALFGLILRFMGFTLSQVWPFLLAGFILLLFLRPRRPVSAIG